ncbi:hypothetical protein [Bradyrhizobium sp. DOA9]|uniref:hypothetical protein n=1 Tax=Bradyrhizobium sp. DOA9 TaxID=1126627 RepID=UPI000468AFD7|nr:hypothetical protein [Bradyrhizobium sp. DOA9]GAJ37831.1 hypothetical protein BDOA9_0204490 [Bradyrhizobium sp. DOA9]
MSPLEAITRWVETQDPEVQGDIGACAGFYLFESDDAFLELGKPKQVEALKQWLSESNVPAYRAVGRALRFRACFGYFIGCWFSDAEWKAAENFLRKVIAEATSAPNSEDARFALALQQRLNALPARKRRWRHVRASWRELVQAHLSDQALRDWSLAED